MLFLRFFFTIVYRCFSVIRFFLIKGWNSILYLFYKNSSVILNVYIDQRGLGIRHNNLGDDLNYYLIKELTGKHIFNYNSFFHAHKTNYICIGSIVEDMTNEDSIIWGGGVMHPEYPDFVCPQKTTAVRGPLTRRYIMKHYNIDIPQIYGDPALLMPIVYKPKVKKVYNYGIIPHISELNDLRIIDFISSTPNSVIIDLKNYNSWKGVIDLLCQCEMIASSSLHGLILADAYGIPNVWMCLNKDTGGGEFKFKDYYEGVLKEYVRYDVGNQIEESSILRCCKDYEGITFDSQKLLKACPFL